jgi:hypothetical protein
MIIAEEPRGSSPAGIADMRVYGNRNVINVQQYSPGAVQHIAMTSFDKRQITEWLDRLDGGAAAAHDLVDPDLAELGQQSAALRQEIGREQPDTPKVATVLKLLIRILPTGGGSLTAGGIIESGIKILNGLTS